LFLIMSMNNIGDNGHQEIDNTIEQLWANATHQITSINAATENWKAQTLPLARIKKIMKIDEGILQDMERERLAQEASSKGETLKPPFNSGTRFMIAGEAPVLLGKACELLIREMTARAWRHTERNRRRTLQRQDVHAAVGESEVYDFLIDIVPRINTNQGPPPPQAYPEQHIPPTVTTTVPMAAPVSVPGAEIPTMSDAERYSLQMQQHMQQAQQHAAQHEPPQVQTNHFTPGYEQYYMQMHQARVQAEVAAPTAAPGTVYMQVSQPPQQENMVAQWAAVPTHQQAPQHTVQHAVQHVVQHSLQHQPQQHLPQQHQPQQHQPQQHQPQQHQPQQHQPQQYQLQQYQPQPPQMTNANNPPAPTAGV